MLTKAQEARTQNDVAKERDELGVAFNGAKIGKLGGEVTAEDLNKQFEESKVKAQASGTNPIKIVFEKTGNEYQINDEVITGPGESGGGSGENLELPNIAETKPFKPTSDTEVTENNLDNGVTIKDSNKNEWVWIEVPKTTAVYPTAGLGITNFNEENCTKIYNDLKTYTTDYKGGYTDTWYDGNGKTESESTNLNDKTGCGLTNEEYKTLKKNMLKSVYENGGFYIGKYEVGTDTARFNKADTPSEPLIQENKYPYNFVTCSQAQELSQQLATGGRESSLMFGVQWDLVLKHIKTKNKKTQSELKSDSTSWGNYYDPTFPLTKGQYTKSPSTKGSWKPVDESYPNKPSRTGVLLTTGATVRNSVLNIYDLAGNVDEWTLEKFENSIYPCVYRGGAYYDNGFSMPASHHNTSKTSGSYDGMGFRPALY